jgi:hypothetical protein
LLDVSPEAIAPMQLRKVCPYAIAQGGQAAAEPSRDLVVVGVRVADEDQLALNLTLDNECLRVELLSKSPKQRLSLGEIDCARH